MWKYVVTDLNGVALGEPRAWQRRVSVGVARVYSAGFRTREIDPLWDAIAAGETMLKVYDSGGALRLYGPVVGDVEEGRGNGVELRVAAADLAWRLAKRFIQKDSTGAGKRYTATDAGTIAYDVLAQANADGDTGIRAGNKDVFGGQTVTYVWKQALAAIAELGALHGSYEWQLRYVDGTPPSVYLDLKAQVGNDVTADVWFEYGTGQRNCSGYTRTRSIDQLATDLWVVGADQATTVNASDADARTLYRRHEDVVSYGDITVTALLDALAAAHVAIRKRPRSIVGVSLFPKTAPRFGVDWNVGDLVSCRVMARGKKRVDGTVRIWGADIEIDESGNERAQPILVPE